MWNRKEKEEPVARPTMTPELSREAIPTASYPTRRVDEATTRAAAVVGKTVVVTGHITGKEDLLIDGRVEGDIDLPENRLTVGHGGHIEGKVRTREIVIYGSVQGNLEASERVEIKKNARVVGDLRTARPVIEDEAYFKGNVETIRVDPPKTVPKPVAPAPEQPPIIAQAEVKPAFEPRKG